ncbi:hypothetical protein BSKO_07151 [Bryopsis sp. KO-2023]|nr:hypothetical protein BSKO_07151 [Bryopsis sp. KO-2023]
MDSANAGTSQCPTTELSSLDYEGQTLRVFCAYTKEEVDWWCNYVRLTDKRAVGFNTQSTKGELTAVVQFCFEGAPVEETTLYDVVLFMTHSSGLVPSLRSLLEDETLIKAGVNLKNDVQRLGQCFGVRFAGGNDVDVDFVAGTQGLGYDYALANRKSTAQLAEEAIGIRRVMKKPFALKDWEKRPLPDSHVRFAAIDAFEALALYEVVQGKRPRRCVAPEEPLQQNIPGRVVAEEFAQPQNPSKARVTRGGLDLSVAEAKTTICVTVSVPLQGSNGAQGAKQSNPPPFQIERPKKKSFDGEAYPPSFGPSHVGEIMCRLSLNSFHYAQLQGAPTSHQPTTSLGNGLGGWGGHQQGFLMGETLQLPYLEFTGVVHYLDTERAVNAWCDILMTTVEEGVNRVIGFDTEWKPENGACHVALVQLCFQLGDVLHVGLFHVAWSGMTEKLKAVLRDPRIGKAGIVLRYDIEKLAECGVELGGAIDLDKAHRELCLERRNIGTRALVRLYLLKDMKKDKIVTTSNWEAHPLSPAQQEYAALDAYASFVLYQSMARHVMAAVNFCC